MLQLDLGTVVRSSHETSDVAFRYTTVMNKQFSHLF